MLVSDYVRLLIPVQANLVLGARGKNCELET
jgi:hypothetical protein